MLGLCYIRLVPTLCLLLLGPFRAELGDQPVVGFAAKAQALLAYLALESGRAHRRADLAELLWPDRPQGVALRDLRYALRDLRTTLGSQTGAASPGAPPPALLLSTHDTLQLDPGYDCWLDVAEFGELAGLHDPTALERAVALYRGPFLEGLAVDSAPFEEWVLLRSERFNRQLIAALDRLATLYEATGRPSEGIPHARRRLELDPWDETAHRQLMRLLARNGQRSAALAQFEACRRVLDEELGLAPARETLALVNSIREGWPPDPAVTTRVARAQPEVARPTAIQFVGRKRELERLDAFLERALAGQTQVAFVAGEAGAGKTALVAEFARRAVARRADLVAISGECAALAGRGDPYLPFRDILRQLAGEVEGGQRPDWLGHEHASRVAALLPIAVQALCQVGPDLVGTFVEPEPLALRLAAWLPDSPWRAQVAERAEAVRQRETPSPPQIALFDQFARLLQTVARRQPLLLIVDDLQWADAGSASLLFHLGRRLRGSRVLVVGAFRPAVVAMGVPRTDGASPAVQASPTDTDGGARHPLVAVLHELGRELGEIEIRLDDANDPAFVEAILDSEPNRLGNAFRGALADHTAGNPLFTVELPRTLQERGSLVPDATGHWVEGLAPDWERLPARVEAVIAERIGRLPGPCQEVLSAASVEGVEFSAEVAARVLGMERTAVVRQLGGPICQQHRLAHPAGVSWLSSGGRLSRYRFRHHLFQRYLYRRLDEAQRASLHEAIGGALEALHGEGEGEVAPQRAWHFERAGLARRAATYLLLSGQRAARLSAHDEAVGLLRHGLAVLRTLPASPERAQQELALLSSLALGPSLTATRGWGAPEHLEVCERAARLCQQLGKTEQFETIRRQLAGLQLARGTPEMPGQPLEPPLAGDAEQEALECLRLGQHFLFLADSGAAHTYLERSLAACLAIPGCRLTSSGVDIGVICLGWLVLLLSKQGYLDQAQQRSRQGLARAQELGDPMSLGFASLLCGVEIHTMRHEPKAVRQATQPLLQIAGAEGLPVFESMAHISHGWARAWLGEVEAGMDEIQRGFAAATMGPMVVGRPYLLALHADACLAASRASDPAEWAVRGLAIVDEALAVIERTGFRQMEPEVWRLRGELLQEMDARVQQAEECYLRAIDVARAQGARLWELRAAIRLTRLLAGVPDRPDHCENARLMLAKLYGWFTEGLDAPDLVEARALLERLS